MEPLGVSAQLGLARASMWVSFAFGRRMLLAPNRSFTSGWSVGESVLGVSQLRDLLARSTRPTRFAPRCFLTCPKLFIPTGYQGGADDRSQAAGRCLPRRADGDVAHPDPAHVDDRRSSIERAVYPAQGGHRQGEAPGAPPLADLGGQHPGRHQGLLGQLDADDPHRAGGPHARQPLRRRDPRGDGRGGAARDAADREADRLPGDARQPRHAGRSARDHRRSHQAPSRASPAWTPRRRRPCSRRASPRR